MRCSICRDPILPDEETRTCEECAHTFHLECWDQNGGCGTPGCSNLPKKVDDRGENLLQATYWGAATKKCPMCRETIDVNALVCPFCKERFDTAAPIDSREMRDRLIKRPEKVKENKGAIVVFICGLLGCIAPFNLIFGGIWYGRNRRILREASPMHNLLAILGLIISSFYTIFTILFLIVKK